MTTTATTTQAGAEGYFSKSKSLLKNEKLGVIMEIGPLLFALVDAFLDIKYGKDTREDLELLEIANKMCLEDPENAIACEFEEDLEIIEVLGMVGLAAAAIGGLLIVANCFVPASSEDMKKRLTNYAGFMGIGGSLIEDMPCLLLTVNSFEVTTQAPGGISSIAMASIIMSVVNALKTVLMSGYGQYGKEEGFHPVLRAVEYFYCYIPCCIIQKKERFGIGSGALTYMIWLLALVSCLIVSFSHILESAGELSWVPLGAAGGLCAYSVYKWKTDEKFSKGWKQAKSALSANASGNVENV